jgi:hypothetical protein
MYPGEYPNPLPRVTNVLTVMVSGYATARLRREDPVLFSGGSGDLDLTHFHLENRGTTAFTVQLKQTQNYAAPGNDSTGTPTGTRFNIGAATALVPGGIKTLADSPFMKYLEVYCTSGSGSLRLQIEGRARWEQMAFDKTDPFYPASLWQAKPTPEAQTLA